MIVSLCKLFKDTPFNSTKISSKNTKNEKSMCKPRCGLESCKEIFLTFRHAYSK